ncbi:Lrp/AsnC family transcriptional regulator [Salipiger sp.]|uniref:Lrp/AsnC family transcriptional regulator n=1 Tax=Salipiger sp. TaxID=2078585 RepID=UPI003A96E1FF
MDDTDQKLIAALRHNARASLSELSAALGLSRTTVRTRMERLQRDGIILGYSAVLRDDTATSPVRGLMFLRVDGPWTERVIRRLSGLPAVREIHTTNGAWDLILELGTGTLEALDQVLGQIRRFDHVVNSETNLMLTSRRATEVARSPATGDCAQRGGA